MQVKSPSQRMLFCTVPLELKNKDEHLIGSGSSFVVSHDFPNHGEEIFIVTNKHVVANAHTGLFLFTRAESNGPILGSPIPLRVDDLALQFHGHPGQDVDVCILPLSWMLDLLPVKPFLCPIRTNTFPTNEFIENSDAVMPILFVGYPNGLFDQKNYTPIVRTGMTATPMYLDFDGRRVFLIDASVFPGSSGSPVFAYSRSWKEGIAKVTFIGIVAEVMIQHDVGKFKAVPAPTQDEGFINFHHKIDLGVVFKPDLVIETIEDFWLHHEKDAREYRIAQERRQDHH